MTLEVVNEGSTAYLTVTFLDKDGNQAAPTSITYRIDCLTTGTQVKGDTVVTPAAQVEITLGADDNAIQDQTNENEERLVTIEASYGASDGVKDSYRYILRNLKKVP